MSKSKQKPKHGDDTSERDDELLDTADPDPKDRPISSTSDRLTGSLTKALGPRIEIIRRLAGGGMSVVYLGRDTGLNRLVAIKVLSEELHGDEVARTRFTREAEAAAAIVDPHVIEIYQVGSLPRSGRPYIVMEFVDGLTLQQEILTGKPIGEPLAKAIVGEVASALATAHEQGVVHRDIKPANIVLDGVTGRAVVLDFGISAAIKRPDDERLTMQGVAVGTPAYMSPEQAAAKDAVGKSDVYSLGVVAFELVTGRLPFEAQAPEGYLAAHLQETLPDVRSLRPDLDRQFAALINRCLSKKPEERPDAEEIARAYIPSARPSVEWPPPGLTELRGLGWKQLKTLVGTTGIGVVFFALLFLAPGSEALRNLTRPVPLLPLGSASDPGGGPATWVFLLGVAIVATIPLTAIARLRGWRIVAFIKWARRLGYPWPVLFDVALDSPDTVALINGHGVFALLGDKRRRRLLALKRASAAAVLASVFLGVLGPLFWLLGFGTSSGSALITPVDAALIFLPWAAALAVGALLSVPEWTVRNQARHWRRSLGLSLPPMRTELVNGWLGVVGRTPVPNENALKRWLLSLVPAALGGAVSTALITILSLTLTAIATASRWSEAGQRYWAVASQRLEPVIASDADTPLARLPIVLQGNAPVPAEMTTLLSWYALGRSDASTVTEPAAQDREILRGVWMQLPGAIDDPILADLHQADTLTPSLVLWRRIARTTNLAPFWSYAEDFEGIASPDSDLPLLSHSAVDRFLYQNELSALTALADNRPVDAITRARETLSVGRKLLADPLNGGIAALVLQSGAQVIRDIGIVTENRSLIREAQAIANFAGEDSPVHTAHLMAMGSAFLASSPETPLSLGVVTDSRHLPSARWWAMAGIVNGFCGNAREVLFGVDGRRIGLLGEATASAGDIPRTAEWGVLLNRWLTEWLAGGPRVDQSQELKVLRPLRWVGLDGLANRIGYCHRTGSI